MHPLLARSLMGAGLGAVGGAIGGGHDHRLHGALGGALGGGAIGALTTPASVPVEGRIQQALGRIHGLDSALEGHLKRFFPEAHAEYMAERAARELSPDLGAAGPSKLGMAYQRGQAAAWQRFVR